MNQARNSNVMVDAERWYARLKSPNCKASERLEFQRWQAVSEHAAAFAATEKLWDSIGKLAGRADLEQLSQQIFADTAVRSPPSWRRFAIAASILIVLLGSAVFLTVQNHETPAIVYTTQPGERSTIKLADGSQLVLNFATELDVRIDNKVRRLTLRKGDSFKEMGTAFETANPGSKVTFSFAASSGCSMGRRKSSGRNHPRWPSYRDTSLYFTSRTCSPDRIATSATSR